MDGFCDEAAMWSARALAADIAGVGFWSLDPRARRLSWDAAALRALGRDHAAPRTVPALLSALCPASRARARAAIRALARRGEGFDVELRVAQPDGLWRWVRVIGRPEAGGGPVARVIGSVQHLDVRTLRDSECARMRARFEAIFENTDAVVFIKNRAGVLLAANRKYLEGAGRYDVVGKTDAELYPPEIAARLRATDEAIFASGERFVGEENVTLASGERVVYLSSKFLIADPEIGETVLCGIATDITAEKRLQVELEASRRAAQAANEAKSQFLATMSHELRTPMNGVLGMLSLLLAGDLKPRQRTQAEVAQRSAAQLLELLDAILDFSRLEAGAVEFERAPFDPAALLRDAVALLAPLADGKGLSLSLTLPPDLPAAAIGDAARLRQILLNLIGNAVKFTARGGVAVSAAALPGGGLRMVVCDTGIGIAAEAQARIFDRFSQADASTTRRYGGTGLGLAICRHLADGMGCRLGVDSAPGRGAAFWIETPPPPCAGDAA
jgi:PAS domain S-box-containing protein